MDIIALASKALKPVSDDGTTVRQGWYDEDMRKLHVTLWSLGDYDGVHADDAVEVEIASVQVNIWSDKDQVSLKDRIKKLMRKAGFYYMGGNDELETDTKVFINAMRFMYAQEAEKEE
nr:hypothetical protein [uncultured Acetatifactor sp.]